MIADNTGLVVATLLLPGLVGLVLYAWYAFALSRLFPKLGGEGWKGWVPVLNEIEILVRGGVPGWSVVFYFIPVVQLYGIYLKALAVHRINESFGRGAGFTVLGIFLPPVWATLLAASRMPAAGDYDRRVERLMSAPGAAPGVAPGARPAADALGTAASRGAQPHVADPLTAAPGAAEPIAAPARMSFPSFPAAAEPPLFITVPPTVARPVPAPDPERASEPSPHPENAVEWGVATPPPGEPAQTPHWNVSAPAVVAPVHAPAAPPPDLEPTIIGGGTAATSADDDLDRTVVVERRARVPWRLVTDEGHVIPLRTSTVLLGRKPSASDGVEVVAVPDATKTLSKNHARLELAEDGAWTVHDLDSTNGVIIIEPDGAETLLPPGGSAAVPGRFVLGKVGMRVTVEDLEETR